MGALRLHPYHAERILGRIPAFRAVIPLVGAHHERVDGQGYYRGIAGSQIPPGARILAVADRYDELTHGLPGHPPLESASALERLYVDTGTAYAEDCVRSLEAELRADGPSYGPSMRGTRGSRAAPVAQRPYQPRGRAPPPTSRRTQPPRSGQKVFLSEHTVRHHLEHIYDKIGVHTRVAATLFAIEHDLLN